jgi:hypothetical protein
MHIPRTVISATLVTVSLGLASPALAQHHRGGGEGGHGSNRGSENHATAAPRATPPPAPAPAPRADSGQRRYSGASPQRAPGVNNSANNGWRGNGQTNQGYAVPRSYGSAQRGGVYRNDGNRYNNGNGYNNGYRNYPYRSYSYHNGHAYYYRPPVRFYQPYYSFRPRFSIGFGLWAGYPVPYAYSYYDPFYYGSSPYDYAYPSTGYPSTYPAYPPPAQYPQPQYPQSPYPPSPYPQSAPDPNSIGVQPGQAQANTGGLSFDITPTDAEVTVDGRFVGTVDQFTANSQPLGLSAGRHQVQIEAPGFQPITFDVNIIAGQVIPYQGSMERR